MKTLFRFIFLVLFLILNSFEYSFADEDEEDIAMIRPGPKDKPTLVEIGLYVINIDSIDVSKQSFTANIFLAMEWNDPRLAKRTTRKRRYQRDEVWFPSYIITNMQRSFKSLPEVVSVSPEGNVRYRQRYFATFSNQMTLHKFPFDSHWIKITLITPENRLNQIKFSTKLFKKVSIIRKDLSIPDWKILRSRLRVEPYTVIEGFPQLPAFTFEFKAKRLWEYYTNKVIFPLTLIVMMSWLVFWIDPKNFGPQIGLSSASMLTLIAYRFTLESLIPPVSYLTPLDTFLLGSTFLVFLALAEVVTVSALAMHNRLGLARKVDGFSRYGFPLFFVLLCCNFFRHLVF